jgi:hypothetical protein
MMFQGLQQRNQCRCQFGLLSCQPVDDELDLEVLLRTLKNGIQGIIVFAP